MRAIRYTHRDDERQAEYDFDLYYQVIGGDAEISKAECALVTDYYSEGALPNVTECIVERKPAEREQQLIGAWFWRLCDMDQIDLNGLKDQCLEDCREYLADAPYQAADRRHDEAVLGK